jgi:hypothetical protein
MNNDARPDFFRLQRYGFKILIVILEALFSFFNVSRYKINIALSAARSYVPRSIGLAK